MTNAPKSTPAQLSYPAVSFRGDRPVTCNSKFYSQTLTLDRVPGIFVGGIRDFDMNYVGSVSGRPPAMAKIVYSIIPDSIVDFPDDSAIRISQGDVDL